ncbi:MAG: TerB family tellurite resistance protein [Candidatus Puniceispirillaceae bacterium]
MLNRFSEWVKSFSDGGTAVPKQDDDFVTTITALLVEAAMADGALDADERSRILHLLTDQLELGTADAQVMLDDAIAAHNTRTEIHGLVRQIRTDTEMEDRIIILEMIWVVVLADSHIDAHESQLMRRLAGLLFIDDVEAGLAAKRARTRLGLAH